MSLDDLLDEGSHVTVLLAVVLGDLVAADIPTRKVVRDVESLADICGVHVSKHVSVVETGDRSSVSGELLLERMVGLVESLEKDVRDETGSVRSQSVGVNTGVGVTVAVQVIWVESSEPQELEDVFDELTTVTTELSHVAAVNAASATLVLQSVPELFIDQSVPVSISDRSVDVEFFVDVSISESHATEVDGEVSLSVDNSGGKSGNVDAT